MIDPQQCRAARALLDWTQADLSDATGLSKVTVRAFEKGGEMRDSNRTLLRLAFEKAGIQFIDPNGGGSGARLRERDVAKPDEGLRLDQLTTKNDGGAVG